MKRLIWICALSLAAATIGFIQTATAVETTNTKVMTFVSILPQAYFVERVGGPHVRVDVLVGPGQSPHTFEPTPSQMAMLAQAQVYFRIGVPFERTLIKKIASSYETLNVVDTRKGIELRPMDEPSSNGDHHHADHAEQERRDEQGRHHGEPDPHIWLDPKLVKIQANTICEELSRIDPVHASEYKNNLEDFHADLDRVHARIADILDPFRGGEFFVFHPAFGYFGDAFGLRQVAVETGGKEPGAKMLAALIERAKREGVRVIFVQRQFSERSARAIAEAIEGAVVPMDPLARDYLGNLEDMAAKLSEALE